MKGDNNNNKEPWITYNEIWPTKAAFFSWLRGGLRLGLWNKYPPKHILKNSLCKPPPEDYTGRAKSGTYCALTGEWTGKSKLEVDHKEGNVPLQDWEDVTPFIMHLCFGSDEMVQLVDKEAHKIKSYAEKRGITFQQAVLEKQVIKICKGDTKRWLEERGIKSASNATKRKAQVRQYLENNNNEHT